MHKGLSVAVLGISILCIIGSTLHQDVFAEKEDDKKEKKKEIKEKIKEKKKEIKEKIKEKKKEIKEKLKKLKEKIKQKIDEKKKQKGHNDVENEIEEVENEVEEHVENENKVQNVENEIEEVENEVEEHVENEIIQVQKVMTTSSFKGGNKADFAPTLGKDVYGNSFVDKGFSFNDFSTDVDNFRTHMPLQTVKVGELNTAELNVYNVLGADRVRHVEIGFGLDKNEQILDSESKIIWEQDFKGIQSVSVQDDNNMLMDVKVVGVASKDIMKLSVNFAFREPMDESMIGVLVWDKDLHSKTMYFNDGIKVVGESLNPPKTLTILDEYGNTVKLTMTGKNSAIDEQGNVWIHNSPWKKQIDSTIIDSPDAVSTKGFDRGHNMFDSYKNSQAQKAQGKLFEILGQRNIYNFVD